VLTNPAPGLQVESQWGGAGPSIRIEDNEI
jgi:hypothetical protein